MGTRPVHMLESIGQAYRIKYQVILYRNRNEGNYEKGRYTNYNLIIIAELKKNKTIYIRAELNFNTFTKEVI